MPPRREARPLHVCVLSWPQPNPPITAEELIAALIRAKKAAR